MGTSTERDELQTRRLHPQPLAWHALDWPGPSLLDLYFKAQGLAQEKLTYVDACGVGNVAKRFLRQKRGMRGDDDVGE